MKILCVVGAVLFLAPLFLSQAYAIELCEARDYYNLMDSSKCSIRPNKGANKNDTQELMFELLKNYPYEQKEKFVRLLQRKIELVGTYVTKQQRQKQTGKVKAAISTLGQVSQDLSGQLVMVQAATQDTWESVRDQARKVLEDASRRMREVE